MKVVGPCMVRTLYVDVEVRIRLLVVEGAIVDCRLSPAVSIVSVPNRVRLLMNPVPSDAKGSLVTVCPLGMVTSSLSVGTLAGLQFPFVFQSVVAAPAVKVTASACAAIGARSRVPIMIAKSSKRFAAPSPKSAGQVTHALSGDVVQPTVAQRVAHFSPKTIFYPPQRADATQIFQ